MDRGKAPRVSTKGEKAMIVFSAAVSAVLKEIDLILLEQHERNYVSLLQKGSLTFVQVHLCKHSWDEAELMAYSSLLVAVWKIIRFEKTLLDHQKVEARQQIVSKMKEILLLMATSRSLTEILEKREQDDICLVLGYDSFDDFLMQEVQATA